MFVSHLDIVDEVLENMIDTLLRSTVLFCIVDVDVDADDIVGIDLIIIIAAVLNRIVVVVVVGEGE